MSWSALHGITQNGRVIRPSELPQTYQLKSDRFERDTQNKEPKHSCSRFRGWSLKFMLLCLVQSDVVAQWREPERPWRPGCQNDQQLIVCETSSCTAAFLLSTLWNEEGKKAFRVLYNSLLLIPFPRKGFCMYKPQGSIVTAPLFF